MANKPRTQIDNCCKVSTNFEVGNSVKKKVKNSDNFGEIGRIVLKQISAGGYHFCWVDWKNRGTWIPEHYDCIKLVQ